MRTLIAWIAVALCSPMAASGGNCGNNSPAIPVPECRAANGGQEVDCSQPGAVRLWQGLRPGKPGEVLHPDRDSTQWASTSIPGVNTGHELFHSLDIVGTNRLFAAYNAGFSVWNIAGNNAEDPRRLAVADGWRGDFLTGAFQTGENDFLIDDIAAASLGGNNNYIIALSGRTGVGFSVWTHSGIQALPDQLYQDPQTAVRRVRLVEFGGRQYAFAGGTEGVWVYDLTQAQVVGPCLQDDVGCTGVQIGRVTDQASSVYIDTISRNGKVYVANSSGIGFPLQIWEVSNPLIPTTAVLKFSGLGGVLGQAFFQIGGAVYLGVVEWVPTNWRLRIYRVTSCLDNTSCNPPLVYSMPISQVGVTRLLTASTSNGDQFLYYGAQLNDVAGEQVEHLLDLSNFPSSVREITEDSSGSSPTYTDGCNGDQVDYWGDYYSLNDHGLRNTSPRVGKFQGNYFYRAAFGILDVHVRTDLSPTVDLTCPPSAFLGETIECDVDVANCSPGGYQWDADGGAVVPLGNGSSAEITWTGTPGSKTVEVDVANCGTDVTVVAVAEAAARVESVSLDPTSPRICEEITFTAENVTGQPVITDSWTITRNADGMEVAAGNNTGDFMFDWDTSQMPTPASGSYTAEVTVSNSAGSDTEETVFTLAPASLSFNGGPTYEGAPGPRNIGSSVQFFADASGDSAWSWNFDDPSSGSNTSNLENPTHTFNAPGTYTVTLEIQSCDPQVPAIQSSVDIEIVDNPLEVTAFFAHCPFGVCDFCAGDPVTFTTTFEGEPSVISYDWDGNGTFEQNAPAPITSHTYNTPTATSFFPQVRISAGGQQDIFTHVSGIIVSDCGPPPQPAVNVSGPTTRTVGQAGTYSASAFNCTPNPTGWTWTASGGGAFSGANNVEDVQIFWTTGGNKTVTARNSSCGSASDSIGVSVTGPAINIAGPAVVTVDQTALFVASTSNCSPSSSGWNWNATGGGTISGNTNSNAVSISWPTAGTKNVSATNSGCSGALGSERVEVISSSGGVSADFTYSPSNPQMREQILFDGTPSDGEIGTYFWAFGDGTSASGPTVQHAFEDEGTYTVSLTVAETNCTNPQCEDTATQMVVVGGGEPPPPGDGAKLILPYFVVDTVAPSGSGLSTLFSIRNISGDRMVVRVDYFAPEDTEPFLSEELSLGPKSVTTINLRLVDGLPFDPLSGLADGYVHVTEVGSEAEGRSISGDVFIVDAPNDFASGSNLLTELVPDLCSNWSVRFFDGGAFDGGTELQFYAPGNSRAEESPVAVGNVYDEAGMFLTQVELFNPEVAFRVQVADLGIEADFGAIEWQFRSGVRGHVAVILKALNRFSVGGPAICQDAM